MAKNKSKGLISRSEPNSVGEEIPYLPIELVTDILLRLSGKLLLRYRRVCKVWCKIIDSPSFANTHLTAGYVPKESELVFLKSPTHRRDTMKVYLLKADKFNYSTINMSEYPIAEFVKTYYSSRCYGIPNYSDYYSNYIGYGLFLFRSESSKKNVFLYNPLRDEVLMLPPSPNWFLHDGILTNTFCGFDNATNEYKIVYICNVGSRGVDGSISRTTITKILTLGTSTWRKITAVPPVIPYSEAVPAYGYIHWIESTTTQQEKLLSFDLKEEEYKLITLPELHGGWSVTLFNLKEFLAVIRSDRDGLVIWILKDYEKQEWVKQYT